MAEEMYLGDSVYARFNGQEIVLSTSDREIYLDTGMLKKLQKMVDNYDPTPWCTCCGARRQDQCKCPPIAAND